MPGRDMTRLQEIEEKGEVNADIRLSMHQVRSDIRAGRVHIRTRGRQAPLPGMRQRSGRLDACSIRRHYGQKKLVTATDSKRPREGRCGDAACLLAYCHHIGLQKSATRIVGSSAADVMRRSG